MQLTAGTEATSIFLLVKVTTPTAKLREELEEHSQPTAAALGQPRSSHRWGGLGKPDWVCPEEVSTQSIPPALERRWSNCWHRSNRKQLGISKVSTSTGCRWTTAKFIYWNDLSSFVSFSTGLRYARRYPGYSISSVPGKREAKHRTPSPSAPPPTQPPKIPS